MAHPLQLGWMSVLVLLVITGCGGGAASGLPATSNTSGEPRVTDTSELQQVRIAWGLAEQQFADLYRPVHKNGPWPVVVMIHGGCWSEAYGLDLQSNLAESIAARGFAVWNIEYRRLGNGGEWPVMFNDVAAAVDYLPNIADTYQLDTRAVTVIGHSAGGHLALWLAGRDQLASDSPLYQPAPLPIAGVISLAGIGDLTSQACGASARAIIAGQSLSAAGYQTRLTMASPIEMLPSGVNTLLASGSRDAVVPSVISETYANAAQLAGDDSEHIIIAGADHFDLIDPAFMDMTLLIDALNRFVSP